MSENQTKSDNDYNYNTEEKKEDYKGSKNEEEFISIYVGNLPYSAREEDIKKIFSKYAQVQSVSLIFDKLTRKPSGYCFIKIEGKAYDTIIKQLDGYDFEGRQIQVKEARSQIPKTRDNNGGDRRDDRRRDDYNRGDRRDDNRRDGYNNNYRREDYRRDDRRDYNRRDDYRRDDYRRDDNRRDDNRRDDNRRDDNRRDDRRERFEPYDNKKRFNKFEERDNNNYENNRDFKDTRGPRRTDDVPYQQNNQFE